MTRESPTGILVIDKPLRASSMDLCRWIRRRLVAGGAPKRVKVGHSGTLDPLATGVVVILVGKATRRCDAVMAGQKRYLADVHLAKRSTTDDREGQVEEIAVFRPPALDQVRRACADLTGLIMQKPPAHSAIWIDGERAYRAARRGEAPEMQPRPVLVHAIDILSYQFPLLRLDIRCGKGTYVRSLARDIGAALGVGGMLWSLRRTAVGRFTIEQAVAIDSLPDAMTQDDLLPIPTDL